ncbi:MAG: TonB-dependent receptor [Acidobacteriaceae bacterium]|nr:TonB-dependent receptor [Acidobacteriaceae bacterium]
MPLAFKRIFLGFALLVTAAVFLWSQTETGQIGGTVTDPTGATVPKANVSVVNAETGAQRATTGSDAGDFAVSNLLPGSYTVTVQAAGFETYKQKVELTVGAKLGLDVKLTIGSTGTVVQVSESAVHVNTETQTLTTVVSQQQVAELPTLTRNPYDFVAISNNVAETNTATMRGVGFAINGQRSESTNVLLDGAANNNEFTASVGQAVPLDSVQEFSVLTDNFTAEYGRASAGIVNVVTKAGTNRFTGSLYEYNRVSQLSSNGFQNNAFSLPKSVFTRNQFGYSVGGPIKKDKLFFFSSTEWIRIRSLAEQTVWLATPQLIAASSPNTQGFFNAYGKLKANDVLLQTQSVNGFAAQGINVCGKSAGCRAYDPNAPLFSQYAYTFAGDAGGGVPDNEYQTVGRVDYNMSDRTQMYGRYALQSVANPSGTVSNSPYQGFDSANTNFNNNALFSVTHTFSPMFVSQSKAVFQRLNNQQPFGTEPPVPTLYVNPTGSIALGQSNVVFPGYNPFTPGNGIPFGGPQNFVQLYEDLDWSHGKHDIRFGGSFEYIRDNRTFGAYETAGDYLSSGSIGGALSNFLAGDLYRIQVAINPQGKFPGQTVSLPIGPPNFSRSNRYKEGAVYVQDSWRVNTRFTANVGVRWEHFGVQHNKNPLLDSNFYDPANQVDTPLGVREGQIFLAPNSPNGQLWKPDWHDFAPRLGFAWDVTGDGRTSLRAGYGIAYERNFGNVTFNAIQNPPNYETVQINAATFGTIPISASNLGPLAGNAGTITLPAASIRNIDPNIQTAYAHTWDVSLEHQATKNLLIGLDYAGSRGVHLYDIELLNRPGYGNIFLGDDPTVDGLTYLNSQYSGINRRGSKGWSNYNALNAKAVARNFSSAGLTMTASYTWSHAMDNLSSTFSDANSLQVNNGNFITGYLDPYAPMLDKGSSDFDIRQRLAVSAVWQPTFLNHGSGLARQVLGGWSIAPIWTAETGQPYSVYDCGQAIYVCSRAEFIGNTQPGGPAQLTAVPGAPNTFNYFTFPATVPYVNPNAAIAAAGSAAFGGGASDLPPFPAGMSGRNAFRAPGVWFLNVGVYKTFFLTERLKLQIRGEAYNIFNHANLYVEGSGADVSSSTYIPACRGCTGTSTDRRNLQLAARIDF